MVLGRYTCFSSFASVSGGKEGEEEENGQITSYFVEINSMGAAVLLIHNIAANMTSMTSILNEIDIYSASEKEEEERYDTSVCVLGRQDCISLQLQS